MEKPHFADEPPDCAPPGPLPGPLPIDSLFSSVRRVKYDVVNTRVGRRTDYDKLTLEIWTDGRISPDEALTLSAAILRHHLDVFANFGKKSLNVIKQKLVEMSLSLGMTFDAEVLSRIHPAD